MKSRRASQYWGRGCYLRFYNNKERRSGANSSTTTNASGAAFSDAITGILGITQLVPVLGCNANNRSEFNATTLLRLPAAAAQSLTSTDLRSIANLIKSSYSTVNGLNSKTCDPYFRQIIRVQYQSELSQRRLSSVNGNVTVGAFYNVSYNVSGAFNNSGSGNTTTGTSTTDNTYAGGIVDLVFVITGSCIGCSSDTPLFNYATSSRRRMQSSASIAAPSSQDNGVTTCQCPQGATQGGPSLETFSQVLNTSLSQLSPSQSPAGNTSLGISLLQVVEATPAFCSSVIETFQTTISFSLTVYPNITTSAITELEQCVSYAYNLEAGRYCDPYYRSIVSIERLYVPSFGVGTDVQFLVIAQCRGLNCAQNVSFDLFSNSASGNSIRRLRQVSSRAFEISRRALQVISSSSTSASAACYCATNSTASAQSSSGFLSTFHGCINLFQATFVSQSTSKTSSQEPSSKPSAKPSKKPSSKPRHQPTAMPSHLPGVGHRLSARPSATSPSSNQQNISLPHPSRHPSYQASAVYPPVQPSTEPSESFNRPSHEPSHDPSMSQPSRKPFTDRHPTDQPSHAGPSYDLSSYRPSQMPSKDPSHFSRHVSISFNPSSEPSNVPSNDPSDRSKNGLVNDYNPLSKTSPEPSIAPSNSSHPKPFTRTSQEPSSQISGESSEVMSPQQSYEPSNNPSRQSSNSKYPSSPPSLEPSRKPSSKPSQNPSLSVKPSIDPSHRPSIEPSSHPSGLPIHGPSTQPSESNAPSSEPSINPSTTPSNNPSSRPSHEPSDLASSHPSHAIPSSDPSSTPSQIPTQFIKPSLIVSNEPSQRPSNLPTHTPFGKPPHSPTKYPSSSPSASSSEPSVRPSACLTGSSCTCPQPVGSSCISLSGSSLYLTPPTSTPTPYWYRYDSHSVFPVQIFWSGSLSLYENSCTNPIPAQLGTTGYYYWAPTMGTTYYFEIHAPFGKPPHSPTKYPSSLPSASSSEPSVRPSACPTGSSCTCPQPVGSSGSSLYFTPPTSTPTPYWYRYDSHSVFPVQILWSGSLSLYENSCTNPIPAQAGTSGYYVWTPTMGATYYFEIS